MSFFNFLFEQLSSPSLRIGMENFDTVRHRCIPSRFTVLKIKIYRKRNNTFLSPDMWQRIMMSQKHRYLSFSLSLTTLSGALMISSGLVLHIFVGAMLLMGPSKNTHSQTMEYESETEHNKHPTDRNAEEETSGPTNQINYDSKTEKSAKQMAFTLFSNPSFIFLVCNCFAFQFGICCCVHSHCCLCCLWKYWRIIGKYPSISPWTVISD